MKISKIEKKEGIYFVTKTPNFIQKLFCIKQKIERYKTNGEVFLNFDHIKVFYKSNGEILRWNNKICKILNNFDRKF